MLGVLLADFHYVLYNCNYDIVLVTESWLTESDINGLLDPEGAYSIVRRDRLHTVGGGVCTAVRRELKYIEVCCTAAGSVEMLCVDVVCFNSKYRFIVISPATLRQQCERQRSKTCRKS